MAIDLNKINLRKDSIINLKKEKGIGSKSKANVVLVLDKSGSAEPLYSDGTIQDVVERVLPFGLAFDDDGSVDTYIFDNGFKRIEPSVTIDNLDGYVNREITKYGWGGTSYSYVLEDIMKRYQKGSKKVITEKKGGFLSGIFGSKENTTFEYDTMDLPVYIIFITDGENNPSNNERTEEVISEMSKQGFFIQFIGVGDESFSFLKKLDDLKGRKIDNANFFSVGDIRKMSDDQLYGKLMTEYPGWLLEAKDNKLIL